MCIVKMGDQSKITACNNVKIGNYIVGETLGCGTFGKVKRAVHQQTGQQVAIKFLNKNKIQNLELASKIKREIQNLKLFRHPHIIKMYEVITNPTNIFMVMEYVSGGELFEYIVKKGRCDESEARRFFQQIISGVDYCHTNRVVHRDLKPENLLLDHNRNVKIADFGLSNMLNDGDFLDTSCGSPNYAAPEVISGMLYAGPEVDIWSCGVILYALVCGTLPFDDPHVPTLFRKIKEGVFNTPSFMSKDCAVLIKHMLKVDVTERATIASIKEAPWFQVDLPDYLFPRSGSLDVEVVDEQVVAEVCKKLNCTEQDVIAALEVHDPKNQYRIAYNLILDSKTNRHIGPPNSLDDFVFGSTPPSSAWKEFDNLSLSPGSGGGILLSTSPAHFSLTSLTRSSASSVSAQPTAPPNLHKLGGDETISSGDDGGRKKKWHLGLRSNSSPGHIMNAVFKAMKRCNFEWKVISPYLVIARQRQGIAARPIKLCLRLYEMNKKQCLLDFQNVSSFKDSDLSNKIELEMHRHRYPSASSDGSTSEKESHEILEFFEMCGKLISELS
ncbi:hypothetical protein ACHWQZ_G013277 [Mnemiopsis leidyi]